MQPSQINSRFLNNLANTFRTKRFTIQEAYKLYERDHWVSCNDRYEYLGNSSKPIDHACHPVAHPNWMPPITPCKEHWRKRTNKEIRAYHKVRKHKIDNWGEMNARNTLAAAAQCGLLIRIEKGIYTFKGTF